jgi:hypothetical protein
MRYVAMQVLTWGTVAGTLGSALLLAALNGDASPPEGKVMNLADAGNWRANGAALAQVRLPEQRAQAAVAEQAASQPLRR